MSIRTNLTLAIDFLLDELTEQELERVEYKVQEALKDIRSKEKE